MIPNGTRDCPSWGSVNVVSLTRAIQRQYNIDGNQTYITGFSWGSAGTWNTIEGAGAGFFKKAVPIAGNVNNLNIPYESSSTHGSKARYSASANPTQLANLALISVWAFHG
jgi:predicted peptidase